MSSEAEPAASESGHGYGLRTTTLLVIASMVGTGVFATTGLLLPHAPWVVLAVWAVGGAVALAGALCYAEVASAYPRSGGEAALLTDLYHPSLGFTAGIVSIFAGFAAPIAACAIAFGRYAHALWPPLPELPCAVVIVLAVSLAHTRGATTGARFQDVLTLLKIALVSIFALAGALTCDWSRLLVSPEGGTDPWALLSPGFAVSLVLVYFAYTGWNAAAYVAGEVRQGARVIPRALALGTVSVTALYVLLNAVFLASAPLGSLRGVVEIGHVAAIALFGPVAGAALSVTIAFGLVSTIGAFTVTGTRVYCALAQAHAPLRALGKKNAAGAPIVALALQAALALVLLASASFDLLLTMVGFTLSLASAAVALGTFVVRSRGQSRFRAPLHPLAPIVFVAVALWTAGWSLSEEPAAAIAGLVVIAAGLCGYLLVRPQAA